MQTPSYYSAQFTLDLIGVFVFALSGGLDPDNVWEALAITGASMVDVSSGVELANEKDEYLVRRFIQSAKAPRPEPKARAS